MIVISGTIRVADSDASTFAEIAAQLEGPTQEETGCLTYNFWQLPAEPGLFRVFEEWDNNEALEAHMAAPHMVEFLGSVGSLDLQGIEISRYEIADKSKFM